MTSKKQSNSNWREEDRRSIEKGYDIQRRTLRVIIGIDEKSFRKGHKYISLLTDLEHRRVVGVAEGRDQAAYGKLFEGLTGFGNLTEELQVHFNELQSLQTPPRKDSTM